MNKILYALAITTFWGCSSYSTDPDEKKCIPGEDFIIQDMTFSNSSYSSPTLILHNNHSFAYTVDFDYHLVCTSAKDGSIEEKYSSHYESFDAYETTSFSLAYSDVSSCSVTITATRPRGYYDDHFSKAWSGSYTFTKANNRLQSDF